MRSRAAAFENIVKLSIWSAVLKLLWCSNQCTYFMDQTSTIHSVDTRFIHGVFKLSFFKQYNLVF